MLYRFSALARADLDDIWNYLAQRAGPDTADRLVDRIVASVKRIASYPMCGRLRDQLGPGVRGLAVGKYVVYYTFSNRTVLIIRIVHGSRDVPEVGSSPE